MNIVGLAVDICMAVSRINGPHRDSSAWARVVAYLSSPAKFEIFPIKAGNIDIVSLANVGAQAMRDISTFFCSFIYA